MTYSIETLANLIYQHHTEFAGRNPELGDINNTLLQTRDFLKSEGPARSANFDARVYIAGSYNSLASVITIGLADDGENLTFMERRAS